MHAHPSLLLLPAVLVAQTPAAKPDPFASLRFLEGTWVMAAAEGTPGRAGAGGFTFLPELDGKVLVRRGFAVFAAKGDRPAFRHEDVLTVYPEAGGLRALFVDNEGHVLHYEVAALADGPGIRFTTGGEGTRFRMEYRPGPAGTLDFRFDTAAPGRDFSTYLKATVRRRP